MEGCREVKGIGRERIGADWLPEEPMEREMLGWEEAEDVEEEEEDPEGLPGRGKWWCERPSGLVVRDRGWACSEWVAAGAAGEARAAEGVAGESSMLP